MITDKTKAYAISLLKCGDSVQQVSEELELPFMLVKDWNDSLDLKDLTVLNATANALTRVVNGQLSAPGQNVEVLKGKIEEMAIKIVDQMGLTVHTGDPLAARSLQLLADTCTKLYATIVNKGGPVAPGDDSSKGLSLFERLSRD